MQRLRSTFKRSKTPTPADMKTQSSLEVPKQVRSASFDEIQLEAARVAGDVAMLAVPQTGARSHSFDSNDSRTLIKLWRQWFGKSTEPLCVHCRHMEAWLARRRKERYTPDRLAVSSAEEDDDDDDDDDSEIESPRALLAPPPPPRTLAPPPPPRTLLTPPTQSPPLTPGAPSFKLQPPNDEPPILLQRRRSISRQEAFFVEPTGSSLENVRASEEEVAQDFCVHDFYFVVPQLNRDRAVSVDYCFSKVSRGARAEEFNNAGNSLTVPVNELRSGSVDIAQQSQYNELPSTSAQVPPAPVDPVLDFGLPEDDSRTAEEGSGERVLRSTPDWGEAAVSGEHLWTAYTVSGENCYIGELECKKIGTRMRCSACRIITHEGCLDALLNRLQFACKPTFRDVGVRQYREQTTIHHHWVHRRSEKGKCKACGKSLRRRCCWGCTQSQNSVDTANEINHDMEIVLHSKLSFSSKQIVSLSCSWCKDAYHNKENCFNMQRIGEQCALGLHCNIIVPPSWIVKLPRKGSFKSSLRKSPKKKSASKKNGKGSKNEQKTFVIKPIPTENVTPVLVFINPKSGGNQGAKLLQKFQWQLNPRQVFDLTQGGPGPGLEMFRKVPNLRVLACGGDGTVGWVLSVLDRVGIQPAVGVLPLGTGNDLARALGWGGGYEDEPIWKILKNIGESDTVLLDRWELKVEPNPAGAAGCSSEDLREAKPDLPLNVFNNYFSFGIDANIALDFHKAREERPDKFNSRIKNKIFYGAAGGKDLLLTKWKRLTDYIEMECDGRDITHQLRELKVHAIVFLNIPSYGGGTHPWSRSGGPHQASTEDGYIEVVGLTTFQLPMLQAGAHGTCITQCRTARIVTTRAIPMQVDGEAVSLAPSIITLSRFNQAIMLAKKKRGRVNALQTKTEKLSLPVNLLKMADYERYHYEKEILAETAETLGVLEVDPAADLELMRGLIQALINESEAHPDLDDWWFVDTVTAERFFRIDKAQEHLHYATDIGNESIFILEPAPVQSEEESTAPLEASASLGRSGPSTSLETTTGLSVSFDISQSVDTASAGVSLDNPESYASESGLGTADHTEEFLTPQTPPPSFPGPSTSRCKAPQPPQPRAPTPTVQPPPTPKRSAAQASASAHKSSSPPLCTSPLPKDNPPSQDAIARFKTIHEKLFGLDQEVFGYRNLLEKTSEALLKAAKLGDLKMLKELHAAGYSLLSIDASGQTALHVAARYGNKEIVKYLIASAPTAILNMPDNERGQTALHKAAANKRRAVCCMLVAGGASLTHADRAGLTPRLLALRAEDRDLAAYLESECSLRHPKMSGQEHFQLVSEELETPV
ncbi:eye-specific diacylglycerol kinase isoform X3 [Cydia pomonella]|uniref:eye-specific diacylglycerol kinase isoform X3 n=1 Tax=Cydia pomonella TaxID=82600 RepID=UPI002ADDD0E6|nr:eye-specific diacylglycerol kinase isoform X3 [Cydia pomonella]